MALVWCRAEIMRWTEPATLSQNYTMKDRLQLLAVPRCENQRFAPAAERGHITTDNPWNLNDTYEYASLWSCSLSAVDSYTRKYNGPRDQPPFRSNNP